MKVLYVKKGKENQEKKSRSKDIHPDGIQVAGPSSDHIFAGKEAGFCKQVFNSDKKLPVKMCYIREKMCGQVPNGLFWLDIFLSTG